MQKIHIAFFFLYKLHLQEGYFQLDLFSDLEEEEKERNIQKAMLAIRNCYGACISATYFERYMEFGNEIGSYHTVTGTVEFISKEKSECVLTIWN